MSTDTASPEQVNKAENKQKTRRETELKTLKAMLSTVDGRSYFWKILSECGVYQTSFTGDNTTFFNEGKRQVGLWLLAEIMEADPAAYGLMQLESQKRESQDGN